MARLMAVSLTEDAVRDRTKTVTRRLGWTFLKPGDRLQLCRKVMGRKRADGTVEPLERITLVEVVSVRREPLRAITADEVQREGLLPRAGDEIAALDDDHLRELISVNSAGGIVSDWFVDFFCATHKGCTPDTVVTRIEWRYLDEATDA